MVMIRTILFVSTLLFASCSPSVTVLNNPPPNVPDSVRVWLTDQSQIIGFYAAVQEDTNYLDTAILPQWAATRVFNAIAALWLDTNLKERDTVFDVYALKERANNDFHSVVIGCQDSTG